MSFDLFANEINISITKAVATTLAEKLGDNLANFALITGGLI